MNRIGTALLRGPYDPGRIEIAGYRAGLMRRLHVQRKRVRFLIHQVPTSRTDVNSDPSNR